MCLYVPCSVLWCSVRLYLRLFVLFTLSYYVSLRSVFCVVMFGSSLPSVVCLVYVILLCVFTFLVLCCDVRFVFTSSCLSYLCYPIMCLYVPCSVLWCFGSSLPPVVCFIYVILLCVFTFRVLCCDVRFVFTSSCLFYLRYPIMCLYVPCSVLWCSVRLYLQLFVLFTLSYYVSLRSVFCVVMFGSSLPSVVCLVYVILLCVFTFLVLCCDVRFVFTSSCLSYLCYPIMCLYVPCSVLWCFGSSLPPVVCFIYVILLCVFTFRVLCCDVRFVFTFSCLSCLRYPIMCLYVPSSVLWCSVRLYLQLFVLFMLSYYVSLRSVFCVVMFRFVFTSSCLFYLRYSIMCLYVPCSVLWCSVRLYLQLFVLFTLSYYVSLRSVFCVVMFRFVFTSSCLFYLRYPIMCLNVPCSVLWCSVRLYLQLFVLFMLSYYVSLRSVFCVVMFGSSLPPVVCFIYVILLCVFTFRVLCCDVRFVFTSSCLSCLRYPIMCLYVPCSVLWCSVRLYLQLFVLFMLSY